MPTSVASLILLVMLAFPGIAYVWRREHTLPERRLSPFRETTRVVVSGVSATFAAIWILIVPALLWPQLRPEAGILIDASRAYPATEYALLLGWGTALVTVATALALFGAWLLRDTKPHPSVVSSWWILFKDWPRTMQASARGDVVVRVVCFLDDGSSIEGVAKDFNDTATESPDRDLILTAPIERRTPTGELQKLASQAVSVSARNIVTLAVVYREVLPSSPPDEDESGT